MFKFECEKSEVMELKKKFLEAFAEMCLSGIDYWTDDKNEMQERISKAVEIIDGGCCGFEDTDNGFLVENDCVNEIGLELADELLGENSYTDLFTRDDMGTTGKCVLENIRKKYPNVGIEAELEYDDGISFCIERVRIVDGNVESVWDDEGEENEE